MDNEILVLAEILGKSTVVTAVDIELKLNITRRQVMYRIDKLNDFLVKLNVPLINIVSNKAIFISSLTKDAINELLETNIKNQTYYFSKRERLVYMYLMMYLNNDYLTLNDFIDCLHVSRSTVIQDYKDLSQVLNEEGIIIENNRKRGYYLVGSELQVRKIMMNYVITIIASNQSYYIFDAFIDEFKLDIFGYSKLVISELAEKYNIRFVEDRLIEFIYIFIFLKARMQIGYNADKEIKKLVDIDVMSSMKEYEFCKELLKNYKNVDNITISDINYISAWILGISYGNVHEDTKDQILLFDLVGKIMTRFELLSGTRYKNTEDIFKQLYAHFRPAYYRLIFRLPIINALVDKVKNEYSSLFQLVQETMRPFSVIFNDDIPDGEIAYLTMHFATIYSNKKGLEIKSQKSALIICTNGIGSSAILYNEMKQLFPEIRFYEPIDSNKIDEFDKKVDIIFATTNVSNVIYNKDVPVIRVSPVMSTNERYQIVREVYTQIGNLYSKQPNVNEILKIISKYTNIIDEEALVNDLISYLSFSVEKTEVNEMDFTSFVNKSLVQINVEASNWIEAIEKSYSPLLDEGYITYNYVKETIRSVKMLGPYIVICKHVALPHAKPEAGALKVGLGISVLKEPVVFNNEENDPVKYLFSLSAIDNHSHLNLMAKFVELLGDQNFFKVLDNAKTEEEIINYIVDKTDEK